MFCLLKLNEINSSLYVTHIVLFWTLNYINSHQIGGDNLFNKIYVYYEKQKGL